MKLRTHFKLALSILMVALVIRTYAADACGGTFNVDTDKIKFDASTTQNTTCIWYITNATDTEVTLVFNSLFLGSSNLTIVAGNDSTSPQIVQYSNYTGTPVIISHAEITKIVYEKGVNDTTTAFDLDFNTVNCSVKVAGQKGVVNSPVYLNDSADISCSYEVSLPNNIDVPILSLTSPSPLTGVSLNVKFDTGNATKLDTSSDVFGPAGAKTIKMDLQITKGTVQSFQAVYQTADKACSGSFTTKPDGSSQTLALPTSNALPIQCYAQMLSSDASKQVFVLTSGKGSSVAGGDSVLFLDGPSQSASVIGSLGGGAPFFVSSGPKMTMIASLGTKTSRDTSLKYKEDGNSKLYSLSDTTPVVNITLDGSKVNGNDVYMQVSSLQAVKVVFGADTQLTTSTVLVHDINAKLLFTFSKDSGYFPIITPVGGSLIIVKGLNNTDKVTLHVSQSVKTDCNQLYQGVSGMINIQLDNKTASGCTTVVSTGSTDTLTIMELDSVSLCPSSKVEIYEGTCSSAAKLGTIDSSNVGKSLPQIQFPAGSTPRLLWSSVDTSCGSQSLTARYWSTKSVCGTLGSNLQGNVQTPNFPNQYPLNVLCNWAVPAQNSSLLYVSANTLQFGKAHSIALKRDDTTLTTFSGKISDKDLPNDMIVTNKNLAMVFTSKTNDSSKLDVPGQGADISYKVLSCGGMVTNTNRTISNPNKTAPVECIWIIQVPAKGDQKSVNIVSANITVTGFDQSKNSSKLEVRDGGSKRNTLLPLDLKKGNATLLSRYNFLWVRYVSTTSVNAGKPFNFELKFSVYNCNSSSLCDNGICLHPDWRCNGIDDCGDDTDERNCNGTQPIPTTPAPQPQPQPHDDTGSKGVASYWVVICLLIGIGIGVAIVFIIPRIMRRARLRNYHSFNNAENA